MSTRRARICTAEEAAEWRRRLRAGGRKVVFTNGCFDLLHAGHVALLEQARALGDALLVGLNSDRSVRRLKGPERPVVPEAERAEVLAALRPVDAVTLFDDETPAALIALVLPDVLVKGSDWAEDAVVGRDTVERNGGRVVRLELVPGLSTTAILRAARSLPG
jgi:D-beta-D-heptose 7-phosphate kinase/D-beta-D-heptose 1-phosphate adenosyltransferase